MSEEGQEEWGALKANQYIFTVISMAHPRLERLHFLDFHKAVLESHSHQIRPSYVHPVDLFNTRLGSESVLEFKLSKTTTMGPQLGRSPAITKAIK